MKMLVHAAIGMLALVADGCTRVEEAPAATKPAAGATATSADGAQNAALAKIDSVPPETLQSTAADETMPGGVKTRLIERGRGTRHPSDEDAVVLYSQIYDATGRVTARGQELIGDPVNDLNEHGREAIRLMVEGEIRRFWFPDPAVRGAIKVTDYELVWISPRDDEPAEKK
jgi:hypothetical protein